MFFRKTQQVQQKCGNMRDKEKFFSFIQEVYFQDNDEEEKKKNLLKLKKRDRSCSFALH